MNKGQLSLKRLGAALLALTLTAGVGMAHGGHGKKKHGKKKTSVHRQVKKHMAKA